MSVRRVRWRAVGVLADRYARAWDGDPEEWETILREAADLARGWYGAGTARGIMALAWESPTMHLCLDRGQVIAELLSEAVAPDMDTGATWLRHMTAGAAILHGMALASAAEEESRMRALRRAQDRATVTPPIVR